LQQYYPNKLNLGPGADRCKVAFSKERDNEDSRRGRRRDDGEEEWKCRVVSIPSFSRP
jgi:RNA-binding protein 5/10